MDNDYIGIKLADGSFFPVIEEFSAVKKRLVLTTVRDNQSSMQINLYKGKVSQDFLNSEYSGTKNTTSGEPFSQLDISQENTFGADEPTLSEATFVDSSSENQKIDNNIPCYVGSLIVEEIEAAKKGEPSVSLVLGFDSEKNLSAEAVDLDSGNHQSLNVSLTSINQQGLYGVPDFDLTDVSDSIVDSNIAGNPPEGLLDSQKVAVKAQKSCRMPCWLSVSFFVIGLIALILALLILFPAYRTLGFNGIVEFLTGSNNELSSNLTGLDDSSNDDFVAEPIVPDYLLPCDTLELTPVSEEEPVDLPKPVLEPEKTEEDKPAEPSVTSEPKKYRIKWGDTLWDIADAHYKNPWKYKDLARYNGIKNPDHIISGTDVLIPPR